MAKVKKLEPAHAAITAAQLSSQVILTVQALNVLAKDYPKQCQAARGLFDGNQKRILDVLWDQNLTRGNKPE